MDTGMADTTEAEKKDVENPPPEPSSRRGTAFWMVFIANWACDFLSALDLTAISTALPTIVEKLDGSDFIWAGSAYALASTAVLPMCGGLVSIFGRKPILLISIAFFAIGSALCGAAQNMNMLIAGRAIQGFGGGGCISVTEIIFADLVPLPERGSFLGISASVWAFACAIGPPIGGGLASSGSWRWLFFLNLPICGIAMALVIIFLRVKAPQGDFRSKIGRMDWLGNIVVIGSTTSVIIALTWGGLRFAWASVQVLTPLCIGLVGILSFFIIEAFWSTEPTVPWVAVKNWTSMSGYIGTFFHGIVSIAVIYYLPVYFQAVQLASPIGSGVDMFGVAFTVAPFAIFCGASIQIANRYRPQNYIGWVLTIVGIGLLTLLDEKSSRAFYIGIQLVVGAGLGMIWIGTQFPILAPLPFSNNAHALAFFTFIRCFAQSWGVAIGGAILQNALNRRLPAGFDAQFPAGVQLAYAAIPKIRGLDGPLKSQVRTAFARSMRLLWQVMIGFSGAGLLSVLLMRELTMRKDMDEQWGLQERDRKANIEQGGY